MKPADPRTQGVALPPSTTASSLFHRLLAGARDHFQVLSGVDTGDDPKQLRRRFATMLPKFEAARAASPERSAIARRVTLEAAQALVYRDETGHDRPLVEHLSTPAEPLPLVTVQGTARGRLQVVIPFGDGAMKGGDAIERITGMAARQELTRAAAAGIRWTIERASEGDGLDLSGHKFVLMGAGAELAPTPLLLQAGADVLWIDVAKPEIPTESFSGTLRFVESGADILTQTAEIVATIEAFAGDDPVRVGMFAYAAGHGREWRLEAAMNAITRALSRGRVMGIGIYISPTSVAVAQPEDVERSRARQAELPLWQTLLEKTGALGPPFAVAGDVHVTRAIVPLQGASYQAAQYVAKTLAAEAFATTRRVGVVSANVAPITNTGSMSLPVFQAGFMGAPLFGVRVFEPDTTRWLSGLLLLSDLFRDASEPDAREPARVFERQIHGGVHAMAYAIDDAIRFAAVYGFVRRPKLIFDLLGRR
jgi:hypothetical protein